MPLHCHVVLDRVDFTSHVKFQGETDGASGEREGGGVGGVIKSIQMLGSMETVAGNASVSRTNRRARPGQSLSRL